MQHPGIRCKWSWEMMDHRLERVCFPWVAAHKKKRSSSQCKNVWNLANHRDLSSYYPCVISWTKLPIHLHLSYHNTFILFPYEVILFCTICSGAPWEPSQFLDNFLWCGCDQHTWSTLEGYLRCSEAFMRTSRRGTEQRLDLLIPYVKCSENTPLCSSCCSISHGVNPPRHVPCFIRKFPSLLFVIEEDWTYWNMRALCSSWDRFSLGKRWNWRASDRASLSSLHILIPKRMCTTSRATDSSCHVAISSIYCLWDCDAGAWTASEQKWEAARHQDQPSPSRYLLRLSFAHVHYLANGLGLRSDRQVALERCKGLLLHSWRLPRPSLASFARVVSKKGLVFLFPARLWRRWAHTILRSRLYLKFFSTPACKEIETDFGENMIEERFLMQAVPQVWSNSNDSGEILISFEETY